VAGKPTKHDRFFAGFQAAALKVNPVYLRAAR
jgi:hypothetical protein